MNRAINLTLGVTSTALLLLALALPASAQPPWGSRGMPPPPPYPPSQQYSPPPPPYGSASVPNIDGVWYNRSNGGQCEVIQRRPDGQAVFVNENGSRAWGTIQGDRVFIPDWNDGRGLRGWIRGNRIVWPDGNYWER